MHRLSLVLSLLLLGGTSLTAQVAPQTVLDFLLQKHAVLDLEAADVAESVITDNYVSGGIQHVYLAQRYRGIPVYNAQVALHYRGAELVAKTNAFHPNLAGRGLATAPAVSAPAAVGQAVRSIGLAPGNIASANGKNADQSFYVPSVSPEPVRARLYFFPQTGELRLAWKIEIDRHARQADYWSVFVDALSGAVLAQDNHVVKCDFGGTDHRHSVRAPRRGNNAKRLLGADDAAYRVFPFGLESPLHGDRQWEINPADAVASPFGWHDVDGQPGPEFTYTRGNNVYAYLDRDDDANSPDSLRADGGEALTFDFFYETGAPEDSIAKAAMTQLFYSSNMLHDWFLHAGFDEASGNFQRKNYGGQGVGNDALLAEAQDGGATNNANFFTRADGVNPVMQMYLWDAPTVRLRVNSGGSAVEGLYVTGVARFGPEVNDVPLEGELAIARDGSANPELVCNPVVNGNEIAGKVALITRGTCNFENKVYNAQQGGAIAVLICNHNAAGTEGGGLTNMADGDENLDVTIPSLFLTKEDCAPLQVAVTAGETVSVTLQEFVPGSFDGDFDNGIVAHEYGHGVSTRLVGGAGNWECLRNDEQMGEGWSDFFTIASTPQTNEAAPDGSEPRGIGNFVINGVVDGRGIRSRPYSTDFAINGKTYHSVISDNIDPIDPDPGPHDLGETWAVTLLDLFWAFVARDGLDPDLIRGSGGNNYAVQLVVEGLKYTRCSPGLLDGRDGILQADEILTGGRNRCLIWEVFARRGMGFSANQGSRDDRTDNVEAYDLSPYCIGGVHLAKTADTTTIAPGDPVTFTLLATSYRPGITSGVTITDVIPAGMTLQPGSVRGASDWSQAGNVLTFTVGDLEFDTDETIVYTVSSDPALVSAELFFDDAENGDELWELINPVGNTLWELNDTTPYSGEFAWFVPNVATTQEQILRTFEPVSLTGKQPALRFFTKYETEPRWDAGIIEVSTDGATWEKVEGSVVRGSYRGTIDERGIVALQGTDAFWGNSNGYQEVIVNLADYANQDVSIRFHWFSDGAVGERGWWIDNIEIIDVMRYAGAATLTSAAGDNWVTEVPEFGVLVESSLINDTQDPVLGNTSVAVFPNPADALLNVLITSERRGPATVRLLGVDGRLVHEEKLALTPGSFRLTIPTEHLPAGIYLVQVQGAKQVSTTKVTLQ